MSKTSKTVSHEVDVTQADIDGGCRSKASNCPGALAINRAVAKLGLYSSVSGSSIDFYTEPVPLHGFEDGRLPVLTIAAPVMLSHFVDHFDGGGPVGPFKFTIELPADLRFYKLTLSGQEADTLSVILANIGGNGDKGPRGHATSLAGKLHAAGVRHGVDSALEEHGLREGYISFGDYGTAKKASIW